MTYISILCTIITGTMLSQSTWYFVAVTWSSNTGLFLYINGDLDASEESFASNNVIENYGVLVLGQVRRSRGIPPINAHFQGHTTNKKFSID